VLDSSAESFASRSLTWRSLRSRKARWLWRGKRALAEKDWSGNIRCIEGVRWWGKLWACGDLVRILWTKDSEPRRGMGVLDSLEE